MSEQSVIGRGWQTPGPAADWREMEARVLAFWRDEQIFARSVAERQGGAPYVF